MNRSHSLLLGAAAAISTSAWVVSDAEAQAVDLFARDGAVAVKERPHPEYEAIGSRLGAFLVFPKVQLDLGRDSNVFAAETDEQADTVWTLAPTVDAQSDWGRHSVTAYARGKLTRYADNDSENRDTYAFGGAGRYDVQRDRNVGFAANYAHEVEPRTASNTPAAIAEPIEFNLYGGEVSANWLFNRLKLNGSLGVQTFDYEDGVSVSGVVVPQDTRDQSTTTGMIRADYALSPATAVFVQVEGNQRRFDVGDALTPLRDSDGVSVLAGVNFELSDLVRGDVGLGYIGQSFDNPLYGEFSGVSGRANLDYFLTELITLGFSADRSVVDSGIIGSAGILSTRFETTADYEFRRNLIIEARAGLTLEEFDTIDRDNDVYNLGLRGTYLLNRSIGVTAGYTYEARRSSGQDAINDYDAHRVLLSLVLQY